MTMRLRLKRLELTSFRGAREKLRVSLDKPLTVIHGPNGSGKSTLLTAIEWALYPQDSVRLGENQIDERRNWEVRHVHADGYPEVVLTLDGEGSEFTVRQYGRRGTKRSQFATATTYADFRHLVFVHQETIRDFLVGPPGPRQEALARLLGAGWAQDLSKGLGRARKELRCDDADRRVAELEGRLAAKMSEVDRLLAEQKRRATEQGLREPWPRSAESVAAAVGKSVEELCTAAGIDVPELPKPSPARDYVPALTPVLDRLRQAGPAHRQAEIAGRKSRLDAAFSSYQAAVERANEQERLLEAAGQGDDLVSAIAELTSRRDELKQRMAALDRKRAVIREAVSYFREQPDAAECPVCSQGVPAGLVHELEQRLLNATSEEETRLGDEIDRVNAALRDHQNKVERMKGLAAGVERARSLLGEESNRLEALLGRTVGADEDPGAFARLEMETLDREMTALQQNVDRWLARLTGIAQEARKMEVLAAIATLEARNRKLAAVRETPEWRDMIALQGALARREQQFRLGEERVRQLAAQLAAANLERVRHPISSVYSHLSARSDFDRVTIDPDSKYEVGVEGAGRHFTPTAVLNLTDLNSLAIAVVAGMASHCREATELDFLILDDPSQGMDETVAARLADVLSKLAESVQLVVATPDPVLVRQLERSPRRKSIIRLKPRDEMTDTPSVSVASVER